MAIQKRAFNGNSSRYAGRFESPADGLMHQTINQYIAINTIRPDDGFQLKGVGISERDVRMSIKPCLLFGSQWYCRLQRRLLCRQLLNRADEKRKADRNSAQTDQCPSHNKTQFERFCLNPIEYN
jgi:hypothetical protein